MHTRPRDETENDRDTSRTVETAREWRDWPRMTAVSRAPARPRENLMISILLANPAYSNNWCWTSASVVMKWRMKLEFWRSASPLRRWRTYMATSSFRQFNYRHYPRTIAICVPAARRETLYRSSSTSTESLCTGND
jgi:hypothetical protein